MIEEICEKAKTLRLKTIADQLPPIVETAECVFRCIVTTHSAANCPLIPLDCDHPFRNIVTTHSAGL